MRASGHSFPLRKEQDGINGELILYKPAKVEDDDFLPAQTSRGLELAALMASKDGSEESFMKHKLNPAAFLIGSVVLCSSCLAAAQQEPKAELNARREVSGAIENITVHSVALERNKLGDPADQDVAVYLPPSYRSASPKRYPSLYLLHGFDSNIRAWTSHGYQEMNLQQSMDALIAAGEVREMIVIVPNGRNSYLGSFYTNSIVSGGWEDFVDRDLVTYMDSHYRTIPQAASRGVAGHSMGGYAAIMMGMKHPELFGAVYAMSPCCLGMAGDLTSTNPFWHAALAVKDKEQFAKDPESVEHFWTDVFVSLGGGFLAESIAGSSLRGSSLPRTKWRLDPE